MSPLNISIWPVIGTVTRSRRPPGVQITVAQNPQVDHTALLAVQGGLGLDHTAARDVHRHIHAVRRRLRPVRSGLQQQEEQEVQ